MRKAVGAGRLEAACGKKRGPGFKSPRGLFLSYIKTLPSLPYSSVVTPGLFKLLVALLQETSRWKPFKSKIGSQEDAQHPLYGEGRLVALARQCNMSVFRAEDRESHLAWLELPGRRHNSEYACTCQLALTYTCYLHLDMRPFVFGFMRWKTCTCIQICALYLHD